MKRIELTNMKTDDLVSLFAQIGEAQDAALLLHDSGDVLLALPGEDLSPGA